MSTATTTSYQHSTPTSHHSNRHRHRATAHNDRFTSPQPSSSVRPSTSGLTPVAALYQLLAAVDVPPAEIHYTAAKASNIGADSSFLRNDRMSSSSSPVHAASQLSPSLSNALSVYSTIADTSTLSPFDLSNAQTRRPKLNYELPTLEQIEQQQQQQQQQAQMRQQAAQPSGSQGRVFVNKG